jgi:hypothetical protein
MAGSYTEDYGKSGVADYVEINWTTDGAGALTPIVTEKEINGLLYAVETIPSATAAPTDNYDVVIQNANGRNICEDTCVGAACTTPTEDGVLANRSTSLAQMKNFTIGGVPWGSVPNKGKLTFYVGSAGNSKSGTIRLFYMGD